MAYLIRLYLLYIGTYDVDAVSGSYFGHGDLPMLVGSSLCSGSERDLAFCHGVGHVRSEHWTFINPDHPDVYNGLIPSGCDNSHVSGVRCFSEYFKVLW